MTTELTPFAFGDNLVRLHTDENGNPWFVAKDVCRVLGLGNVTEALRNLDEDEKITLTNPEGNPRAGIPHEMNTISESGLYALVFRSRKPEARAFSKWVRAEVLPALRKTGSYAMPERDEAALPQGLSSKTIRHLQTFSGPRIILTESVLRLAELIGISDRQTATTLFDVYAAVFFDKKNDRAKPELPEDVEKAVWNDIERFFQGENCSIRRKAQIFVSLCDQIKKLRICSDAPQSIRDALLEHLSENYE